MNRKFISIVLCVMSINCFSAEIAQNQLSLTTNTGFSSFHVIFEKNQHTITTIKIITDDFNSDDVKAIGHFFSHFPEFEVKYISTLGQEIYIATDSNGLKINSIKLSAFAPQYPEDPFINYYLSFLYPFFGENIPFPTKEIYGLTFKINESKELAILVDLEIESEETENLFDFFTEYLELAPNSALMADPGEDGVSAQNGQTVSMFNFFDEFSEIDVNPTVDLMADPDEDGVNLRNVRMLTVY